jgi:hypothetical protein
MSQYGYGTGEDYEWYTARCGGCSFGLIENIWLHVTDLLLRKLRDLFGLSSVACRLIGSFLDSRSQRVRLNGNYSESVVLTSGSPQESVLSPLVFACFINDVISCGRNCSVHCSIYSRRLFCLKPLKVCVKFWVIFQILEIWNSKKKPN